MSFLIFPWWLAGLLAAGAAAIPIVIHLLHRQRTHPIYWGAMQFLKESPLQQRHRKKIDHWLLMLLRIGIMILLVLLLAWPRKNKAFSLLPGSGAADIAVVVDHSLSTGRHVGKSTVLEQSTEAVNQLVKSGDLKAGDTLSVVLAEHQPRKLNDRPITAGGADQLVARLKQLKPGLSDASIPDAIAAAREVLSHGRNARKVVVVLGDEQRIGWKVNDLSAWNGAVGTRIKGVQPDIKVYEMPIVPDGQAGNITVADLSITPALIGGGRPATITASVLNSGSRNMPAVAATLLVDGKQAAQQQVPPLGPGQSRTLRFDHAFASVNSNWIQVQVDADDSLAADNSAVASAYVWQQLPVLVIDGQLVASSGPDSTGSMAVLRQYKNSRFLLNAMLSDALDADAPPLVHPTVISALDKQLPTLKLNDYAAVVVNDAPSLPSAMLEKLHDYARAGHGVWFILGRNTDRQFIQGGFGGLFNVDLKEQQGAAEDPPALEVKDPHNEMVDMLTAPEHNVLAGVRTYRWWALSPRTADGKTIVSAAGSNDPLILDRPIGSNGGRIVIWCTSVEGTWNNWPTMKMFAPLVNVTLHHLAAGQTKGMENRRLASGQAIVWAGPAAPIIHNAQVILPDGSKVDRRPVVRDGRQIVTFDKTDLPGKYELRFDQTAIPQPIYYGVGIDRAELDPTALNDQDRQWLMSDNHRFIQGRVDPSQGLTGALGGGEGSPNSIWPWLAGFVLLFLLGETWMTYRMIRRQTAPSGIDIGVRRPAVAAA